MRKKKYEEKMELQRTIKYLKSEVKNLRELWSDLYFNGIVNLNTMNYMSEHSLHGYGPRITKHIEVYEEELEQIDEGTKIDAPKDGTWVFLPSAMFPNKKARYCLEVKEL